MKSNLLKLALLALTITASASAESVHATIPFEFTANGKMLPAGTYTVRTISGVSNLLLFVNESTNEKALAFVRTALTGQSVQSFTIQTAEKSYELSMPSGSRKAVLLTIKPAR
jgi:hypothetical protein